MPLNTTHTLSLPSRLQPLGHGLLLCVALMLTYVAQATPNQAALPATSFYRNFQGLALVNQHQQAFELTSMQGKVVLFNFIYTQCSTVCKTQTKALAQLHSKLPAEIKKKVQFISVSLDPLHDTPSQLNAFAKRMGVDAKNWSFLTGKPNDIAKLSDQLSLFAQDKKNVIRPNDHSTTLWLVDGQGRLMMRYSGNPLDQTRLINDLSQLANN